MFCGFLISLRSVAAHFASNTCSAHICWAQLLLSGCCFSWSHSYTILNVAASCRTNRFVWCCEISLTSACVSLLSVHAEWGGIMGSSQFHMRCQFANKPSLQAISTHIWVVCCLCLTAVANAVNANKDKRSTNLKLYANHSLPLACFALMLSVCGWCFMNEMPWGDFKKYVWGFGRTFNDQSWYLLEGGQH